LTAFSGTMGKALPGLVADMALDAALARMIREKVLVARRRSIRAAFERAVARGESGRGFDIDVLIDMLTARTQTATFCRIRNSTPNVETTLVNPY
jgi:hypothetical protein